MAKTQYDIICDWLSFSMPVHEVFEWALNHAAYIHADVSLKYPELCIKSDPVEFRRGSYTHAFDLGIGGKVFFKFGQSNYLVEITGIGCHKLRERGLFREVIETVLPECLNVTRLDIAVDFETDMKPEKFAAIRGKRWINTNHVLSETGDTYYVGSSASDRHAKVYRYYEPHERSHLLRVEMTYTKKGGAWRALMMLYEESEEEVAIAMGNTFGWGHPLWSFDGKRKIKGYRVETGNANTKRWIRNAVIPALRDLYQTDVLDDEHPIWRELAEYLPLVHEPGSASPYIPE